MQKYLGLLSVFGILFLTFASSAEDVYVDLSVLDTLDNRSEDFSSEALFPVYGIPVHREMKAESKPIQVKTAAKPAVAKVGVSKPIEKIKVPNKPIIFEKIKPAIPVLPAAPVKPVIKNTVPSVAKIEIPKSKSAENAPVKISSTTNEPNLVEKIKRSVWGGTEKIRVETKSEATKETNTMSPFSVNTSKEKVAEPEPVVEVSTEKPVEVQVKDNNTATPADATVVSATATAALPEKTLLPAENELKPLIPEDISEEISSIDSTVRFAADLYELSDENKTRLSHMAEKFSSKSNKILIAAYNFDSGDNSFKTKRLNLNRAVEIRSFLLSLGYKNFSIKIINTDNRDKENLTEVSELVY